jgi:mycothiol S-conjugate amidase
MILKDNSMGQQFRMMAVHAHPDDESTKGGATMAKYTAEGVDVLVVTCTGGERGSVLNPKLDRPEIWRDIPRLRRGEMERATRILGIRQTWLGFIDSGLPEGEPPPPLPAGCFARQDVAHAAEPLVRLIREFRPHVMTTYDETGGYPHPDHIMTHKISAFAFEAAGDPERFPAVGEPWQPLKLYYHFQAAGAVLAQHDGMLAAGLESPFGDALLDEMARCGEDYRMTTRIECAAYFGQRDAALRAHETQIDPDGPWFSVPLTIRQREWPTEDYQLVRSLVDGSLPEDDLFAGVHEMVTA